MQRQSLHSAQQLMSAPAFLAATHLAHGQQHTMLCQCWAAGMQHLRLIQQCTVKQAQHAHCRSVQMLSMATSITISNKQP
jgi:hypothetical protein